MSAHRDHVTDEAEGGLVGRHQLAGAADLDGGPVRVDAEDGVDLGGEQVGRADAPVTLGEVQNDGGVRLLGQPPEPLDDPADLARRGGGLRQDQATGRDDDQRRAPLGEEVTLGGLAGSGGLRRDSVLDVDEGVDGQGSEPLPKADGSSSRSANLAEATTKEPPWRSGSRPRQGAPVDRLATMAAVTASAQATRSGSGSEVSAYTAGASSRPSISGRGRGRG
jgi:hypothetical protein